MAIVRNNLLREGVSGMFGGKLVFKLLRGKTIVAKAPKSLRAKAKPSATTA